MLAVSAESFACEYDGINRMFDRITTPVSLTEQRENVRFFFGSRSAPMVWMKARMQQELGHIL
jgi:hypothetical protein